VSGDAPLPLFPPDFCPLNGSAQSIRSSVSICVLDRTSDLDLSHEPLAHQTVPGSSASAPTHPIRLTSTRSMSLRNPSGCPPAVCAQSVRPSGPSMSPGPDPSNSIRPVGRPRSQLIHTVHSICMTFGRSTSAYNLSGLSDSSGVSTPSAEPRIRIRDLDPTSGLSR
jgi:hypothetical protein